MISSINDTSVEKKNMCSSTTTDYHGEQEKSTGKKILLYNFYRCLRLKSQVIILGDYCLQL